MRGPGPLSSVGGSVGTAAGWTLRRGFPPGPGRGSRLSLEKARTQRVAGEGPRPPFFRARSFPLAGFGVVGRSEAMLHLFRSPCTCPDLGRFFCAVFKFYARQPLPIHEPTPPSPPSWGAGRYGRRIQGRRPGRKKERTPAGSPQTRKGGSREEEPLPPWCSFLRLSSKESRAPPAGVGGGNHVAGPTLRRSRRPPNGGPRRVGALRGAAPRGFEKAPTTRRVRSTPPPPAGGAAPSHVSGSGSPRMVASGWKMAQKKSLSRARISRSSR